MYEKILLIVTSAIVGVVIKHIWEKYSGRLTKLRYTIWHNYVGSSVEDLKFGSVKLQYNDQDVNNLYTSTLVITNNSGNGVSDLELVISCDQESLILVSHAKNRNSLKELGFTNDFNKIVEENLSENKLYLYQRRDYLIPVINRGDVIDITLLTTNTEGHQPIIYASTDHLGVRLNYKTEPVKLLGVSQTASALIGILVSAVICIPIALYIQNILVVIALTLLNGWVASLYGVLILKVNELLVKWQNR